MASSLVSKSSDESDATWEALLPPDIEVFVEMIPRSALFRSKKEIYDRLCEGVTFGSGNKFCFLEKSTVKKCYRLGARELSIVSASEPKRWTWTSMPGSRFPEVAKLRRIRWLDMDGSIYANWLSPKTLYAAYLLLKFDEQASGLDEKLSELKIEIGNLVSTRRVYLINSVDNNSNKEEDEDGVVDPDQDFNNNEDEDSIPNPKDSSEADEDEDEDSFLNPKDNGDEYCEDGVPIDSNGNDNRDEDEDGAVNPNQEYNNNSNKEEDEDGVVDPDQDFNNNEDEDSIPNPKDSSEADEDEDEDSFLNPKDNGDEDCEDGVPIDSNGNDNKDEDEDGAVNPNQEYNNKNNEGEDSIPNPKDNSEAEDGDLKPNDNNGEDEDGVIDPKDNVEEDREDSVRIVSNDNDKKDEDDDNDNEEEEDIIASETEELKEPLPDIVPRSRDDGWMEIELGYFFIEDGDEGEIKMTFKEVSNRWKTGLIIEGIEVRPLA